MSLHGRELRQCWPLQTAVCTKIQAINQIYAEAAALAGSEEGAEVRTFCNDEMTGIQVLEHLFPDKPTAPGMDAKMEFDYIRHGTTLLTGFFNVTTGMMAEPYLNSTRTKEYFVAALKPSLILTPENSIRLYVTT